MQNRAYSFITVKSFDESERIIEGIASTPTPDRAGDIVEPMGAKFKLPIPFLWQHQHDKPIGHVVEATLGPKGIAFKAQIAKTEEAGPLKDLLDFAWQSIKMKLVGAVSIGFKPLEYAFLDEGGIRFSEWDWFELSAVTVPAQPEAVISAAKSIDAVRTLDAGLRKAAGVPEPEIPQAPEPAASGKSVRVVKLDDPARAGAKPFVIREIKRA